MLMTDEGMVMLVKPVQLLNAYFPMLVTDSGMVMLVKPLQPENASFPMLVTDEGMVVVLQPATRVLLAVAIIALQLSRESYFVLPASTLMLVKPVQ